MSFIESPRFPDDISYGSSGGPGFNTDVITVNSGYETRNQNWVQSRSKYDAAFGIRTEPQLSELVTYFQSMAGKLHSFRYKDWGDFMSCDLTSVPAQNDQLIGSGNGTNKTFQIIKNYITGSMTRVREISKPISGTVLVEVNNILLTETVDYDINYSTGVVTLDVAPLLDRGDGNPEEVKCGYEYDVPCRFDTDELNISFEAYSVGSLSIPIIEVRI